ncbi:MAG TPA: C1 family peptidase [Pseudobdellovibrionaceae bacterium]|jgi:hypothetical protein
MFRFIGLFLLIGFFLFNTSSQSFAAEADPCPSVDFRERFGPLKNQGFHQICWAMAGSSLIEEEACLMDPKYCGVNFSAVDLTSCDPRVGHNHEENVVDRALSCAQIQGVCPNHLAPFVDFRMKPSFLGRLTMSKRFQQSKLFKLFDEYKYALNHKSQAKHSSAQVQSLQTNLLKEFRQTFSHNDFTDAQLTTALKKSKDAVELLDRTLISNACKQHRVKFPGIGTVFTRIFPDLNPRILDYYTSQEIQNFSLPVSTQMKVIVERFKTGRSLALSICPEKFSLIENMMIPGGDCVAGHAIVANALRRNPETQVCEVHLMDSRKEASTIQFNGWFNLEEVANATIAITQIVPKKNKD